MQTFRAPTIRKRLFFGSSLVRDFPGSTLAAFFAPAVLTGCSAGATNDPALGSLMRIAGAQYVPGAIPASPDGPGVASIDLKTNTIWPGYADKEVGGSLGETATAAVLALSNDLGYWIVTAGAPDFSTPTLPTFRAIASFSRSLTPGAHALEVHAVDAGGRFGPASAAVLTALTAPPSVAGPAGPLVVSLTWDTEADLDLHVVSPQGEEVYHDKATTLDTFSPGNTGSDGGTYGYLDNDSNASCAIDGRRQESVTWVGAPPAGRYLARVDAPSLCGQAIAHFGVRATWEGASIGQSSGVMVASDTWGPHDRGAGILALSFDVP
jgi:hypothetical protein